MGKVISVCISNVKGQSKDPVPEITAVFGSGIKGDVHAGNWHRQISLLATESVEPMREKYPDIPVGAFAESILTEGIELKSLPVGTMLQAGSAVLAVTQIGKECHADCAIRRKVGDCVMPREGIFTIVLKSGTIRSGDTIEIIPCAV